MRQIIAMGGGGFSMEPENPLLDHYVLRSCGKPHPKVCFVPTASGDSENYVERFYASFASMDCVPSHLSLFRPPSSDLEGYVLDHDVIYVGGGNTKNLLALWREWGLDHILRNAWEAGILLAGVSAGSICWFEEGITDSFGVRLDRLDCLGFLPGSNCPHYDGEAERRPTFQRLVQEQKVRSGWAADDGVALHFIGTAFERAVSSRPSARAWRVECGDGVAETPVVPHYLGEL